MSAILQLDGLSKSFGAVTVADALSYDLPQGEALGHHRPERCRQNDDVQPDHGNAGAGCRDHPVPGTKT